MDRPKKHIFGKGHHALASCQVSSNSVQQLQRRLSEVKNVSANLCFSMGLKNTNLIEDVEYLLFAKFCQIPFSGC